MFGTQFYPTPKNVIAKMLSEYFVPEPEESDDPKAYRKYRRDREYNRLNSMAILDPEAGRGDILDYIEEEFPSNKKIKRYCMEIDPDLQYILREKGYKVIGSDFLQYSGDYYFDLIVMNPPFKNGDDHFLKAWDILREGQIICLLNAETIRNAFSEKRKLIRKIISDNNGTVEFIGAAFKEADRKTMVDCCIIKINKKAATDKLNFNFENTTKEKEFVLSESILKNPPAMRDVVGNMISQYEKTKEYFIKYLEAIEGLNHYGRNLIEAPTTVSDLLKDAYSGDKRGDYNDFNDLIKQSIWNVVLGHLNMEKYMTHGVRRNFSEFCEHQGAMDFTKENVSSVVDLIFTNKYTILDQAIVDVFDTFTQYHKQNRCWVEGWKTNDKWKVNRNVILPGWIRMTWEKPSDRMRFGAEYALSYHKQLEYSDIDKVMCYITGVKYEDCYTIKNALQDKFAQIGKVKKGPYKAQCESEFFNIKFFMKGTIHLEFKDEKLWQEFNLRACAGKSWLPDSEMQEYHQKQQNPVPEMLMLSE